MLLQPIFGHTNLLRMNESLIIVLIIFVFASYLWFRALLVYKRDKKLIRSKKGIIKSQDSKVQIEKALSGYGIREQETIIEWAPVILKTHSNTIVGIPENIELM